MMPEPANTVSPSRSPGLRHLAVALALVLVLGTGVVYGLWTDRWQPSLALEQALTRVAAVPLEVAGWKGVTQEADAEVFRQAGAQASWVRVYTNANKPGAISVILMCGRAGRMAVHTPEVCYRGAGYELVGSPELRTISAGGESPAHFWSARFVKDTGTGADLRLYWAWNADGAWQAPASPRWLFRGKPFLYKLYVAQEVTVPSAAATDITDFLGAFLPALEAALFPARNLPRDS